MPSSPVVPLRVVIVGGGIAALETVLALHAVAGPRVDVTLVAPEMDFLLRALTVPEPSGRGHVDRLPLADVMTEHGGRIVHGVAQRVDADARTVVLSTGQGVTYDALVLAAGANAVPAYAHALTFGAHPKALAGLLADLEEGWSRSVAFVVPRGCAWPLPLYELALMTAEDAWAANMDRIQVHVVTPEQAPLEVFGAEGSAAVAGLLAAAGITLHLGVDAQLPSSGRIRLGEDEPELRVDLVVALPLLEGPRLAGVPASANGFIPVDDAGRVVGLDAVYAVGDVTDRPIKQGGLACQQANVTAAHLARLAGADVAVPPLEQVLRGWLLTGAADRIRTRDERDPQGAASTQPLWWSPMKLNGSYLSPYLVSKDIAHPPPRCGADCGGVEVEVPLTWRDRRGGADGHGVATLGLIGR